MKSCTDGLGLAPEKKPNRTWKWVISIIWVLAVAVAVMSILTGCVSYRTASATPLIEGIVLDNKDLKGEAVVTDTHTVTVNNVVTQVVGDENKKSQLAAKLELAKAKIEAIRDIEIARAEAEGSSNGGFWSGVFGPSTYGPYGPGGYHSGTGGGYYSGSGGRAYISYPGVR